MTHTHVCVHMCVRTFAYTYAHTHATQSESTCRVNRLKLFPHQGGQGGGQEVDEVSQPKKKGTI